MSKRKQSPAVEKQKKNDDKQIIIQMFDKGNEIQGTEKTKPIDEATKKWNMNDKITELFANKIESDTNLKGKYAVILISILIGQLVILNILFVLRGLDILRFADVTFNIFITGGIAEVFVLVRTIVKYLFSDNLTELLKIILRANNNSKYKNNKKNENDKKDKEN